MQARKALKHTTWKSEKYTSFIVKPPKGVNPESSPVLHPGHSWQGDGSCNTKWQKVVFKTYRDIMKLGEMNTLMNEINTWTPEQTCILCTGVLDGYLPHTVHIMQLHSMNKIGSHTWNTLSLHYLDVSFQIAEEPINIYTYFWSNMLIKHHTCRQ